MIEKLAELFDRSPSEPRRRMRRAA